LTGDPVAAPRAAAFGLVNQVTGSGGALDGAVVLAEQIAGNGPLAAEVTKRIALSSHDWGVSRGWAEQAPLIQQVMDSADAREGALAFAEKRLAVWTGR
jgi:enoyl-CoA hydratase